jgi:hypothetical protein
VRRILTTLLELVGVALIVAGIWLLSVPLALMAAGIGLIGISYLWTTRGGHS